VQTEIKQINATTKEILLTVEAPRVDEAYQKYLVKAAKSLEVPGFRKGKAPLRMVANLYSEKIKDYFEKDFVDEVFGEAAREHDLHFLMYPEVKELNWEAGKDMTITFEIEHEPAVEIKETSGLQVPYKPIELEQEVTNFIENLTREHGTVQDFDVAETNDRVQVELSFSHDGHDHKSGIDLFAVDSEDGNSVKELIGAKVGDKVNLEVKGARLNKWIPEEHPDLDAEATYPCTLEVSAVNRYVIPTIDNEFAKDMEFDSLEEMRAKIADDLRVKVEHRNLEGENSAIIGKLFKDNPFSLPPKTLRHIVSQELENTDPRYRDLLSQYYIQHIVQEMTAMYLLKELKNQITLEVSDEMLEEYITHRAILEDVSIGAYKEQNAQAIADEDFRDNAKSYYILRQIAVGSEFVEPVEEPVEEETLEASKEDEA
jgi:trigger factor